MEFIKIKICFGILLLTMLAVVSSVSAAELIKDTTKTSISNNAKTLSDSAGYEQSTNEDSALFLVQTTINIFLSVIGVLLLVYILYAGYNWLTAQGEEEKVQKAKDTIKRAIVGAIIIIAAYAISSFVMTGLEKGTLNGGDGGNSGGPNIDPLKK